MDANIEHACSTLASEWMGVIAEAKLQLPCSEAVACSAQLQPVGLAGWDSTWSATKRTIRAFHSGQQL